jgi:hypothetical protein
MRLTPVTLRHRLKTFTLQVHELAAQIATTPPGDLTTLCRLHDRLERAGELLAEVLGEMHERGLLTVAPLPVRQAPPVRRLGERGCGGGRRIEHKLIREDAEL